MSFHQGIHIIVKSCIRGYNTSYKCVKLFVVMHEHYELLFQLILLPYLLDWFWWCTYIFHSPFMNHKDSCIDNF